MRYIYTSLEDYVKKMYWKIGVYHPRQLDIELIAARHGITVVYVPAASAHAGNVIFLDNRLDECELWEEFCHELCHSLWHGANQLRMPPPFRDYQEWTANNFALHACVPTFMLEDMGLSRNRKKAIWEIQRTFNVTYDFAEARLDKFVLKHAYAMFS